MYMTRTGIISLVVLAAIVLAGIGYWAASSGAPQGTLAADETASTTSQSGAGVPAGGTTTLKALATQGGNYTCSLYTLASSTQVRGTLYIAGNQSRVDLVSSANGTDVTTHVIRTGGIAYSWVDGQVTGTKTAITSSSPIVPAQPQGGVIEVSDTAQLSSNCYPWVPDASQFAPPTAITFLAE
jgi:hypothetical protein